MKADIIQVALSEAGVSEIVGPAHNPRILSYFHDIGHKWVSDDENAWCAATANWILMTAGYEMTPLPDRLRARSFENYGTKTNNPEIGDLAVFWRISPTSGYGHVGFYCAQRDGLVWILGGNQLNKFELSGYKRSQLLGFRIPVKL